MNASAPGLRRIGTSYVGKEPHEHVTDVLRALTCTTGAEIGFEPCLTSRPFTARTWRPERLGAMTPGRDDAEGSRRAALDLHDALDALCAFGYRVAAVPPGARPPGSDAGGMLIAGPLEVEDRWCPPEDRVAFGGAWRYVVVEAWLGDEALAVDPISGGCTTFPASLLIEDPSRLLAVERPPRPPDAGAIADRCLGRGAAWRAAAARGPDRALRDGAGLRACAEAACELIAPGAAHRLRGALANQALQAFRWAGMLGSVTQPDIDVFALADVLAATASTCRDAASALLARDAGTLERHLRTLADAGDAVTELAERLAARP